MLRLGAGIPLAQCGIAGFSATPLQIIEAVAAVLVLIGLWTPIAGAGLAIGELAMVFSQRLPQSGDLWTHILLIALGVGLALLGPGAWSIDARLFGRKLIEVGDRTKGRKSTPLK